MKNPVRKDYGKTWNLRLRRKNYVYPKKLSVVWHLTAGVIPFHIRFGEKRWLRSDGAFYKQWKTSPFADAYLTQLAELAIDQLGLGKANARIFSELHIHSRLCGACLWAAKLGSSGHFGATR